MKRYRLPSPLKAFKPKVRPLSASDLKPCGPDDKVLHRPYRLVGRRALLRALMDEYREGDPISKLYVSLLAKNMLAQDPKLLKNMSYELECCGVELETA